MFTRRAFLGHAAALAATPAFARPADASQTTLKLQRRSIEVNGKPASVLAIRQPDGRPGLVTMKGARFRVRVENELKESSLVHWHGLTPPSSQDGVPGISGPLIPAGGAADYDFPLDFGGTYWMHSHHGFQEQLLMSAPLIVRDPARYMDRQEIVVMATDFSFTPAQEIYDRLSKRKGAPDHMAMGGMKMGRMTMSASHDMSGHQLASHQMPGHNTAPPMKMDAMKAALDLHDVHYDAFLANERTLDDPEIVRVENGGRALLRLINGASMSAFHVELGALTGKLVAVDGQDVLPLEGNRFPIAAGQRLDILLDLPYGGRAFPVLFVLEGDRRQTGVILAPPLAEIRKAPALADSASAPLDLELESRLTAAEPLAPRPANKTIAIDLTGDMARYVWSINDVIWNESTKPFMVSQGDRVEIAMTNRTMMAHPMHLHGHRFQIVEIDERRFDGPMRDTALVPPNKRVTIAFDADNPGHWAFHCHLLYHASAGMFATIKYE